MSEGKYIITALGQHLETLSTVTNFLATVNGHSAISIARSNPVGQVYPQITLDLDIGDSHPQFSTTEAFVNITLWLDDPQGGWSDSMGKMKPIMDAIRISLDERGQPSTFAPLTDINVEENIGLRVSRFLKLSHKEIDWDDQMKKFFSSLDYNLVMSENGDFTTDYGSIPDGIYI